jgi:hypothetical protein
MFANMTRVYVREHVTLIVGGFYTAFGMDYTDQDLVTNLRVTNNVIFVTVTG